MGLMDIKTYAGIIILLVWAVLFALVGLACKNIKVNPLKDIKDFFNKQSPLGRIVSLLFFLMMTIYGGTKPSGSGSTTNDVDNVSNSSSATNNSNSIAQTQSGQISSSAQLGSLSSSVQSLNSNTASNGSNEQSQINIPAYFTNEDFERGFVLTSIKTDENFDFSPPETGAIICNDWRKFGAATDWMYVAMTNWAFKVGRNDVDTLRVFSFGKVEPLVFEEENIPSTGYWFAPFLAQLGVVPEANEELLLDASRPSQVWYRITPYNSLIITWQNVLLERDTNKPVSFQVEFNPDGLFTYRYDLSNLGSDSITNIVAGASFAGNTWATNSLSSGVTSMTFYQLSEEDSIDSDPDGDGISTFEELYVYGTNPHRIDSDFDGLNDYEEISIGSNPLQRDSDNDSLVDGSDDNPLVVTPLDDNDSDGIPDAYENHWFSDTNVVDSVDDFTASRFNVGFSLASGQNPTNDVDAAFMSTNCVAAIKITDGFVANTSSMMSNIYERTFNISRNGSWEQFYISSNPENAGGWQLEGVVLEWEDSEGKKGSVTTSPFNDSYYIPVSTNSPASLTIRLRQTDNAMVCYSPLYLLAYSPNIEIESATHIDADNSQWEVVNITEECVVKFSIDRKERPCNAALYPEEACAEYSVDVDKLQIKSANELIYINNPGIYPLPEVNPIALSQPVIQTRMMRFASPSSASNSSSHYLVCLNPMISYGGGHSSDGYGVYYNYATDEYTETYEYPLDSECLWRSWHVNPTNGYSCRCEPKIIMSADIEQYPDITTNIVADYETATGTLSIGGVDVWTDTATHNISIYGNGSRHYLSDNDCDSCSSCETGDCEGLEGADLGSVKFRIPLGFPNEGLISGFAWFLTDVPMGIGINTLQVKARNDATITDTTANGIRTITCSDRRGRTLIIQEIENGIEVVVKETSTGKLEHTWQIFNENGFLSRIRLKKISRLNNIMSDDTYLCYDYFGSSSEWSKFDNITQVWEDSYCEESECTNGLKIAYSYISDNDGNTISMTETHSERFGSFDNAVMRETYHRELNWDGSPKESFASYYTDNENPLRNGCLRLEWGNNRDWQFFAYDTEGRTILTLEQEDGSMCPTNELNAIEANVFDNADITNWALRNSFDSIATVYDYTPLNGDDADFNDSFKARTISRYRYRTLIGRTWKKYSRGVVGGLATITTETITAGAQGAKVSDARNSHYIETCYDNEAEGMPLILAGKPITTTDEDGITTSYSYSIANGILTTTKRTFKDGVEAPTMTITESCATYGNTIREWSIHIDSGISFDETRYLYDNKNRLVSTIYPDGTFSTNAYSCCRLLYTIDRSGRKTLRSALTGQDHLYYAEEEISLADLPQDNRYISYEYEPDGAYRVTQHFMDAFGRETNTVTRTCAIPGAATNMTWTCRGWNLSETTRYPYGVSDYAISTDARGIETTTARFYAEEYDEVLTIETNKTTLTTTWRNGESIVYEEWSEDKWRETSTRTYYDSEGCRSVLVSVDTSDYHTVDTNHSYYDFLGRTIRTRTPIADIYYTYDGSSSRVLTMRNATTGEVITKHYNNLGNEIGQTRNGVTSLTETNYEVVSNILWSTTSQISYGTVTNGSYIAKQRLTGLSNNISEESKVYQNGVLINHSTSSFDPTNLIQTVVNQSATTGTTTTKYKYGIPIEETTPKGTIANFFDPFGRVFYREKDGRSVDWIGRNDYGDTIEYDTFYSTGSNVYAEFYVYDIFGNRVITTNALNIATTSQYDECNRITEIQGATYPTRYGYDTSGRLSSLSTTRDGNAWDITQWEFDEELGLCTSKTYADGSVNTFTYTDSGEPLRTTYASGHWKENSYNEKREVESIRYSDGELVSFDYDEFSREIQVSNNVSTITSHRNNYGYVTNETTTVSLEAYQLNREFDDFGRITFNNGQSYEYDSNGYLVTISNGLALVEYSYAPDKQETGYSITLPNGVKIIRAITRDTYRRSLITSITNFVETTPINGLIYSYDAINRVITRNNDSFGYNTKSEVTSANISNTNSIYGYDEIGNSTNWVANCLNQYTSFTYDIDGNLLSDETYSYTYDVANQLKTVSANGVMLLTNDYDSKSRRVRKVTPTATTTYFYDDWNLIEERIAYTNGGTSIIHYYWGKDLSGSFQGAGGVGGLLYLIIDGSTFVPLYDNNGNITHYLDSNGNVVAQYTYDAFGNTIAQSGLLANTFRHRYSTKYLDTETSLYYYGYRYYHPTLMRWLNRDPIEETGGINLYAFCGNDAIIGIDVLGLSAFILLYDSVDPLFKTWANDIRNRIRSNLLTRYGSGPLKYDSRKDIIYMIPVRGKESLNEISKIDDIKYLASFGHGADGKFWWGYIDKNNSKRSIVTGMNNYKLNDPKIVDKVPLSILNYKYNKCDFLIELYHCTSAREFETDKEGLLVFSNPSETKPKIANRNSTYRSSSIFALKQMLQKNNPQTKFNVVGSIDGVSNGFPFFRGWPRANGEITRIEVVP